MRLLSWRENLDPRKFLRIHRGTVVNVDWIKEVTSLPGGAVECSPEGRAETQT